MLTSCPIAAGLLSFSGRARRFLGWLLVALYTPVCALGQSVVRVDRREPLNVTGPGRNGFSRVEGVASGIQFTNEVAPEWVAQNRLLEDGAGVAAGDIDGDGRCDLYFCRTAGSNALYRNLGGWKFEEVTSRAGVACEGNHSTGAVLVDVDGDADLDLVVAGLGTGVRLFVNDGRGRFTEAKNSGLRRGMGSRSLTLGDFDGDGQLDLYVANYRSTTIKDSPVRFKLTQNGGKMEVPVEHRDRFTVETTDGGNPVLIELGEPDVLYRNLGRGRFEEISWTSGVFRDAKGVVLLEPPREIGGFRRSSAISTPTEHPIFTCATTSIPWIVSGSTIGMEDLERPTKRPLGQCHGLRWPWTLRTSTATGWRMFLWRTCWG